MDTLKSGSLCLVDRKRSYGDTQTVLELAIVIGTFTQSSVDFSRTLVKFVYDGAITAVDSKLIKDFDIDVAHEQLKLLEVKEQQIKKQIDGLKNVIHYYGVHNERHNV